MGSEPNWQTLWSHAVYFAHNVVCETFEQQRMTLPFKERERAGILIGVREYGGDKAASLVGVHWLLIHAPANYVGVYAQTTRCSIKREALSLSRWKLVAYHDSCWRGELEVWLRWALKRGYLPAFGQAWEIYPTGPDVRQALRELRQRAYGENGRKGEDDLHWRTPKE